MDVKSRNYLLMNRQALENDIKTSYIMDRMISDEVLTLQEEERVKQQVELSLTAISFSSLLTYFTILLKIVISNYLIPVFVEFQHTVFVALNKVKGLVN